MTDAQAERLIKATERVADTVMLLVLATGRFDVSTAVGVELTNAVRERALAALGIDAVQEG